MKLETSVLSILIVDDDKNIRMTLNLMLSDLGHQVALAQNTTEAIAKIKSETPDLILTDFRMEGGSGLDLMKFLAKQMIDIPVIVMTAFASIENAIEVTRAGAFDYIPKPFSKTDLTRSLLQIEKLTKLRRENQRLRRVITASEFFHGFTSPIMEELQTFISSVSETSDTVLLTGESGTGKTALARVIHEFSPRAGSPFATVYCTTLAESVLESELFGHIKGAFTGAIQNQQGKIENSAGGTLFLDEVGELSLQAQTRLLRFLQDRIIVRVGDTKEIELDTRIIAATNKNLEEAVAKGAFREDLFYRLNVLECEVPALRQRKEDLPVLIQRLLQKIIAERNLSSEPELSPEILDKLTNYDWPGNIRELRNVLERIVILSKSRKPQIRDLPLRVMEDVSQYATEDSISRSLQSLEEIERQHISNVLKKEPNQEKAASILGISTVTLWKKRKLYGLP